MSSGWLRLHVSNLSSRSAWFMVYDRTRRPANRHPLIAARFIPTHPSPALRPSPFTNPLPFPIRPSPFTIRPSPFPIRPSPFTIRPSPFTHPLTPHPSPLTDELPLHPFRQPPTSGTPAYLYPPVTPR